MTLRRKSRRSVRAGTLGVAALASAVITFGTPGAAAASPPGDTAGAGQSTPAATAKKAGHQRGAWRFDATATTVGDVARVIGADRLWASGLSGKGVGVALIDTGVVPVEGLSGGNVVNGPDLSVESQAAAVRYLDTYGHGTHLAGIIAGSGGDFRGVAPGATVTSVKVGAYNGVTDVSQVIAALDWVVEHRADDPARPIRVINLSYGTDGIQDHQRDPLTHAVENAWRAGIVVVVAGGNGGTVAPRLANPAYDPYVIAVGASDTNGTVGTHDDVVADFSSRGDASRRVDLVAPGRSIVSLRNPGAYIDATYPEARVGDRFVKGSGTSQAAAVVSGAVALLLDRYPTLTPDQVKAALVGSAAGLPRADEAGRGAGALDVARAVSAAPKVTRRSAAQAWPVSTGLGTLEAARGSVHLSLGEAVLTDENDLFGPFDTAAWARASTAGTAWVGGTWMGRDLTGAAWASATGPDGSWAGRTWSGLTWSGRTWSGLTWSGLTWSGLTWSGRTWSGLTWSGLTWSGLTWSGRTWSGLTWSGRTWSGLTWSGSVWS